MGGAPFECAALISRRFKSLLRPFMRLMSPEDAEKMLQACYCMSFDLFLSCWGVGSGVGHTCTSTHTIAQLSLAIMYSASAGRQSIDFYEVVCENVLTDC